MNSTFELRALSALASFLLQTVAVSLVCGLLARLATSAHRRFQIWLCMLLAFTARWLWMGTGLLLSEYPGLFDRQVPIVSMAFRMEGAASGLEPAAAHTFLLSTPSITHVPQVMAILAGCYLLMVLALGMGGVVRRIRLHRAMRFRIEPSQALQSVFHAVADQRSFCGCTLWVLPGLTSPATLGWWRARILVPAVCEAQDPAELREIFWHELKHIERRDALWNALAKACRTLLWFHPGVHYAVAAMSAEREIACDLAVVRDHPQSRDAYAACLLRFARLSVSSEKSPSLAIELTSASALLNTRVRFILAEASPSSRWSRSGRAAGSLLLLGTLVAAMPAMRILLKYERPFTNVFSPHGPSPAARIAVRKRPRLKPHVMAASIGVASANKSAELEGNHSGLHSTPREQDAKRAAENRAGLNILTESTGYEGAASQQSASPDISTEGRDPNHGSSGLSSSWTSVAVGVAQGIGTMAGGGDHDHDHGH
jgi:beta-lactamase regulating signal transducer with metallopeptidase domain